LVDDAEPRFDAMTLDRFFATEGLSGECELTWPSLGSVE
jgi:hypothetical protein